MTSLTRRIAFTLAPQPPLPFKAAEDYADQALAWSAEVPDDLVITRDLAYGPDAAHRYDVFAPMDAQGLPVLVFWHGGGWTNGYKEFTGFMASQVARLNMVLVAPTYRLAPDYPMPAPIDDCRAMLAHLVAHGASHGIDATRMYLSGHSAGGHLAMMTALQPDALEQVGVPAASIRGCLPISGILDLHHTSPEPGSLDDRVYTAVLSDRYDDAMMSPISWTRGNRVPMRLSYGENDSARVILSNRRTARLLAAQPASTTLTMRAGMTHFDTHLTLRDPADQWYADLDQLVRNTDS
ncbi:alpha/beta hydrolase [Pigmentiphaga litoralis]|uniref:Acetyl esterase/lipase n=1 Tax=Pigmentiphaga litoralis TaxID=516702 RepID=A0A7Y9IUK4_9BURK|nr:alpha/beta hydrolase [Pigmentiphaga litoralis]NYE23276.1 acetyl esterase/lipase [Pigmentiphaga litoralis]NYE83110.1 acetyl esterase/lipase [Pigmentiphaga litoralis]